MSSYTRKPEQAIAKCSIPGCTWKRIYFHKLGDGWRPLTPKYRARMALSQHRRRAHDLGKQLEGCCGNGVKTDARA